jgi:hypothetical protein
MSEDRDMNKDLVLVTRGSGFRLQKSHQRMAWLELSSSPVRLSI